jgi:hypothetical protein
VTPYETLLTLGERELARARAGQWDAAGALAAERAALAARLPARPPADARPALEALAAVQAELLALVAAARDAVARELARVARGQGAVRGYGSATPPPRRVDDAA